MGHAARFVGGVGPAPLAGNPQLVAGLYLDVEGDPDDIGMPLPVLTSDELGPLRVGIKPLVQVSSSTLDFLGPLEGAAAGLAHQRYACPF